MQPSARTPSGIRLLSTLAVQGVLLDLEARQGFLTRHRAAVDWGPTALLLRRIEDGARGDVALLTAAGIDGLIGAGILRPGSRVDLAVSRIGLAVRAGAPHPDIGTLSGFVDALRRASSVCYSKAGASGLHFAALLDRLGLAETVGAKALVIASGLTGEPVARGQAEIAVQQVSELMAVPGIEIVGPFPPEAQQLTTFSGGIFADGNAEAARTVLLALADPCLHAEYVRLGLSPAGTGREDEAR